MRSGSRRTFAGLSMSMIKSLTSTLVGAALQQGAIASLDDVVSKYIPALRGCAYDAVTVRHLITMSSGVRWNGLHRPNSDVNRYSKSLGDKVPGGVLALMRSLKAEHRPGRSLQLQQRRYLCARQPAVGATGKTLADVYVRDDLARSAWSSTRSIRSESARRPGNRRQPCRNRAAGFWPASACSSCAMCVIDGTSVLPSDWIDSAAQVRLRPRSRN